ncbi:MAG TPA: hypothetical protein VN957_27325 [Chthoniobacterales bacterium]|nr:hypothetical protein [Chthoniobacterales bacterium]
MPQSITIRVHRTITLALNDLCTCSYSGIDGGEIYMKNLGPGKAWVSFDVTKPATVADVNNVCLAVNDSITFKKIPRNAVFTLNADTASTVLTLTQL